jgi:hypothetical protein
VASEVGAPVAVKIRNDRYPASVEPAAYFVVAEALTNGQVREGWDRAVIATS